MCDATYVASQLSSEDILGQRCERVLRARNATPKPELPFSAIYLAHRSIYISRSEPKASRVLTKSEYAAAVNRARTPAAAALTVSDSNDGCTA